MNSLFGNYPVMPGVWGQQYMNPAAPPPPVDDSWFGGLGQDTEGYLPPLPGVTDVDPNMINVENPVNTQESYPQTPASVLTQQFKPNPEIAAMYDRVNNELNKAPKTDKEMSAYDKALLASMVASAGAGVGSLFKRRNPGLPHPLPPTPTRPLEVTAPMSSNLLSNLTAARSGRKYRLF